MDISNTASAGVSVSIVSRWQSWAPQIKSILRIVAGFLFMTVGLAKLVGFPAEVIPGGGTVALMSLIGIASLLEIVGGGLLILGLFTRPVAFIVAGEMAVAYFIGHAGMGFWPLLNGGTDAVLFCFIWLYFSAAGAGPWSLDTKLRK